MTAHAVLHAAQEVQQLCDREGWRFCFIGGLAVQRWGEARLTVDVDLTLLTGFGSDTKPSPGETATGLTSRGFSSVSAEGWTFD